MPRGKQSPLPVDQIAYLESGLAEFLEKQPHLTTFWTTIKRGWFERWRVEPTLGLPIIDSSIEESPLTEEQETAIGQAETKIRKRIHSWYNNRSQKEKRLTNVTASNSAASGALNDIVAALGRKAGRRKQMIELWRKRNGPLITEALANTNFSSLMGTAPPWQDFRQRKARIQVGHRDQMALRRRVEKELFAEGVGGRDGSGNGGGLDQLAPMLKAVHGVISDVTGGWVGTTILTGPVPKEGSKIGTHSYCNGVTPAGHTMDQAVSGWATQWVKPLQQFGKKVFNHKARCERAIGFGETVRIPATQPESSPDPDDSWLGNHFGDASMPPPVHDEDSIPPPPHVSNPGPLLHVDEIPIDPALLGIGGRPASVAPAPTQETGNHPAELMFPGPASSAAPCSALPICHLDDDFVITSISAESSSHSGLLTSLVAFRYNPGSPSHRPHGLSLPAARAIGTMAATPSPTANVTMSPASMVTLSRSVATPAQSPAATHVSPVQSPAPAAIPAQSSIARPSPLRQTVWTPNSGTPDSAAAAGESIAPRTGSAPTAAHCRLWNSPHPDLSAIGGSRHPSSSLPHPRRFRSHVQCVTHRCRHGAWAPQGAGGTGCGRGAGRGHGQGGNRGRGLRGKCGGGKGSGGGVADRESGTGDDGDSDIGTGEGEPTAAPHMVPPGDA
ncbi:hypothetical protein B0H14DRAFT_3884794 [Mycena olivaceomarginata]|nr:hypothetical protein B0H14DRAFT_3884794 [Mycena olivaceomarginata]